MLLRRIGEHLEEQNWLAVGLDLAMVVLGVFIGLQVDTWNERRIERAEEAGYLVRLHSDVTESIEGTRCYVEFMTTTADRALTVLRDLERCSVPQEDRVDFANGLYHLGKLAPASFSRGTIDELVSTGKLSILRSSAIREELSAILTVYEEFAVLCPFVVGRITPHVNYVDANVVFEIEEPTRGNATLAWDDIELDLPSLCRDRRFYGAVAAVRNYTYDVVTWNRTTLDAFEAFRRVLEVEIDNAHMESPTPP